VQPKNHLPPPQTEPENVAKITTKRNTIQVISDQAHYGAIQGRHEQTEKPTDHVNEFGQHEKTRNAS